MPDSAQGKTSITHAIKELSSQLLNLAISLRQQLKEDQEVSQELMKDPFTQEAKEQTATAELLILLLHICDRVTSATLQTVLPDQYASTVRSSFLSALVGVTIPAFIDLACPEEDEDERAETQADLLYLYDARTTQYGFFHLSHMGSEEAQGGNLESGHEALLKIAGIRLAEALECPDNEDIIIHAIATIVTGFHTLQDEVSLQKTIAQLVAGAQ